MFEDRNISRRTLLRRVRDRLVERARRRDEGTFTADDIHVVLNQTEYRGNRQSVIATLLNPSLFRNTGFTVPSDRPEAKQRRVFEWTV